MQSLGLIVVLTLLHFRHWRYFGNYDTLRKDFDRKIRVVLHRKIDLNLHLVKRTSRAAKFFNVSETETYWINLAVIGLLIAKVFLKHNINIFITYSLYSSFYHFFHYIGPKKRFSHDSKITLCATEEFFLIGSNKICDDSNNENQYLCLQLNCLNQIKCHKKSFSLSEINTSTSRWYKFKPRANSKRSSKRELETETYILYIWI